MNNVIQTQTMPKGKHQQTELSTQVRALLTEGRTVEEIMALTGTKRHLVGLIKYHMERQANQRISKVTGKPVRRYVKRKKAKAKAKPAVAAPIKDTTFVRVAEAYVAGLERTNIRLKEQLRAAPKPEIKTQYIEIEVPQPHYNLTWRQRFAALFLGRV